MRCKEIINKVYNITSKQLDLTQNNLQFAGSLKTGYTLNYNYKEDDPFRLESVDTKQYSTEGDGEADTIYRVNSYDFDENGNLTLQLVDTQKDSAHVADTMGTRVKNHLWDEENRLLAINDNGFVSNYFYDAAGERTVKISKPDLFIYVNSSEKLKGDSLTMKFVGYVSPYLVVTNGGRYTKHIYAGTQRIASKLGDIDAFGADPRRVAKAGHDVDGAEEIDFGTKYKNQNDAFKARFDSVGAKFNGKSLDDYVNGKSFCCNGNSLDEIEKNKENTAENAKFEDNLYFYHPDHLGSTSMVTNYDGEVTQNVAYIPYGEVFVEERNGSWNTPFLFNAKELDEETGLYYYEARYLNPVDCRWLSPDPMQGKYPGMSPYNYCSANPIKLVDPDGRENTIYVVDLQDKKKAGINIDKMIDKANKFFAGLGLETRLQQVSADKFDPSKMDETDSYVVMGSFDSKLRDRGQNPMKKALDYVKKNMGNDKLFEECFGDWYGGGINPERTATNGPRKFTKEIAIDGSGVINHAIDVNVDPIEFAAFIILHAAGHTAGYNNHAKYGNPNAPLGDISSAAIMGEGDLIDNWLKNGDVNINQLIFGGFQLYKGEKFHHNGKYHDAIKRRYGIKESKSVFY